MKKDSIITKFASSFLNNYRAAVLLVLSLILLGTTAYTSLLKREGFPEVDVPIVQISAIYPVEDINKVDQDVTRPLEITIAELDEVKDVSSYTTPTGAIFIAELQDGYTSKDGEKLIKDQITGSNFTTAEVTYSTFDASKIFGEYDLAFSISKSDDMDLEKIADKISVDLQELPEVLKAERIENYETQVNPITNQEKVVQKSFARIGKNINGNLKFEDSIFIGVTKSNDSIDAIELSDAVNAEITSLKEGNSQIKDVEFIFGAGDSSTYLRTQITSLEQNALGGLLAVVVILFFFVSWRASLVTALFIPTVMLTVFLGLYAIGYSLNVVSLFSLILVLGLFVDDAIVVVEAIDFEKQRGKKGKEAVLQAIRNVGSADLMGSITTILVFAPMLFITGILGKFIILIPITVILSLAVSVIIGLSIVPLLSNALIRKNKNTILDPILGSVFLLGVLGLYLSLTKLNNGTEIFMISTALYLLYIGINFGYQFFAGAKLSFKENIATALNTAVYGPSRFVTYIFERIGAVIGFTLKTRIRTLIFTPLVIIFSLVLIMGSMAVAGGLKFSIFSPPKDSENIMYSYSVVVSNIMNPEDYAKIDQSEKIAISESIAKDIENKLQDYSEYVKEVTYFEATESGATVDVLLTNIGERDLTANEISNQLNTKFEDYGKARVKFGVSSAGPPEDEYPFAMQIFSDDAEVLKTSMTQIGSFIEGVELSDGQKVVEVSIDSLLSLNKKDGKRYAQVKAKFTDNNNTGLVTELQTKIEKEFDSEKLKSLGLTTKSLGFDFGQESENLDSFQSTILALAIALILMYGLLVLQYKSFLQPLIIFLAIPLAFPGLFPGLAITNNPLSFFVSLGIIGLAGIVVNNSIMLVDYANQAKAGGKSSKEAIAEAAKLRFRPIITTSATTIAGLTPLAFSDPFWEGLAFSIIFGLIASSILIIFILPYYYILIEGIRDIKRNVIGKLHLV